MLYVPYHVNDWTYWHKLIRCIMYTSFSVAAYSRRRQQLLNIKNSCYTILCIYCIWLLWHSGLWTSQRKCLGAINIQCQEYLRLKSLATFKVWLCVKCRIFVQVNVERLFQMKSLHPHVSWSRVNFKDMWWQWRHFPDCAGTNFLVINILTK